MAKNMKYEFDQAERLKASSPALQEAPIYTVLLALVQDDGIEEVAKMMYLVAKELDQLDELKKTMEQVDTWEWS